MFNCDNGFSEIETLIGQGDKRTVYSILHWILQRVRDLKRRAYLAKFLVTLAIPDDYMMDSCMTYLYIIGKS